MVDDGGEGVDDEEVVGEDPVGDGGAESVEDGGEDPDEEAAIGPAESLWMRPDGEVRHLHEYCPNLVVDFLERTWPWWRDETGDGAANGEPAASDQPDVSGEPDASGEGPAEPGEAETGAETTAERAGDEPAEAADGETGADAGDGDWKLSGEFEYLAGFPRWVVAHTPFVVPVAGILYVLRNVLRGDAALFEVVATVVARLGPLGLLAVVAGALLFLVLPGLVVHAGFASFWDLLRAAAVYGTLSVLALGTGYGVTVGVETAALGLIRFAGYLLLLYLGGLLVYDAFLRMEVLFSNLGERAHVDGEAYERLFGDLRDDFRDHRWHARAFAVLFALLFESFRLFETETRTGVRMALGEVAVGDLATAAELALSLLTPFLNVFIVLAAFQFLVLVRHFHLMLTGETEGGGDVIRYEPFHPDGRGGFGDLGGFATRINELVVLGGLYIAYRFLVFSDSAAGSGPASTGAGIQHLATTESPAFPGFLTLAIVAAYGTAVFAWLYYSFWMLHREMATGKQECLAGEHEPRTYGPDSWTRADLRDAPEWPISYTQLVAILFVNLVPIVVSVVG